MTVMQDMTQRPNPGTDGWVEHWLDRYCPPDEHRYRAFDRYRVTCAVCGKNALLGRRTCMICEIPGEHGARLIHGAGSGHGLEGKLCGPCLDDLRSRGAVRGWSLAETG